MLPENSSRVDRSAFEVTTLSTQQNDMAYWQTKTPAERIEALETIRQIVYGYDPATARLQKVLSVTKLK